MRMTNRNFGAIPALFLALMTVAPGVQGADSVTRAMTGANYPGYPSPDYDSGAADEAIIRKGEYLARAADCIACHSAGNDGAAFAGGLRFATPFGAIWTPNITPDKKTGIGEWSDQDFISALKHGKSPQGKYYYPVFPYAYFALMPDEDVIAVKAYLFSIPPVEASNKPADMDFPFNWRFLQLGWRLLYFDDESLRPESGRNAAWERGRYLVNGPGHCSMCHTAINKLGAPKQENFLAGAFVEGYYAPNITQSGLSDLSVEQVADIFSSDRLAGGRIVAGPMSEVVHDSLAGLSHKDQIAIATYLKTVRSSPPEYDLDDGYLDIDAGKKIYQSSCIACHGSGPLDAPVSGSVTQWESLVGQGLDALTEVAIQGDGDMPARGSCEACSDEQLRETVAYMLSLVEDQRSR